MEDKQTPRYKHSCDNCTFLGHYDTYDLYVCSLPNKEIQTLVARYSDRPSNYYAGLDFAMHYGSIDNDDPLLGSHNSKVLFEALRRATTINYKPPRSYLYTKGLT